MRMRWAGHVARIGGEVYTGFFVRKLEGKRPLKRPRCRWEDNNNNNNNNSIGVIKNRMRWAEHVALMGERRGVHRVILR